VNKNQRLKTENTIFHHLQCLIVAAFWRHHIANRASEASGRFFVSFALTDGCSTLDGQGVEFEGLAESSDTDIIDVGMGESAWISFFFLSLPTASDPRFKFCNQFRYHSIAS
jgi:hypothetical protein